MPINTEFDLVIFLMPWEVDAYSASVNKVDTSLNELQNISVHLHVCLCLSGEIIDWSQSSGKIQPVIDLFNATNTSLTNIHIQECKLSLDSEVLGCVDWRRQHIKRKQNSRPVIWLDCDIVFPEKALSIIHQTLAHIDSTYFILTPQIPRMWDNTWDYLVHVLYKENELGQYLDFDTRLVELNSSNIVSEPPQTCPEFKFAGGWFTTISNDLLQCIQLPDAFKPYGEEDTYLMNVCEGLCALGWPIKQYVSKNMLVAQDLGLFDANKNQLKLIYNKDRDVLDNKAMKQSLVDEALLNIGSFRSV